MAAHDGGGGSADAAKSGKILECSRTWSRRVCTQLCSAKFAITWAGGGFQRWEVDVVVVLVSLVVMLQRLCAAVVSLHG